MKVRLTFKTPNVVEDSVARIMDERQSQNDDLYEDLKCEAIEACKKWVKHGEYLTVEIDTEKGTCEVIPV